MSLWPRTLVVAQSLVLTIILSRINAVLGIPASIKPMDPIVVAGSNITFRCVLNTSATTQTVTDIVWYYKSYSHLIPRERYEVEDNISRLTLRNVTFADSGSYFCAFESDGRRIMRYQGSMLRVGMPPSPPTGLRCHSSNMQDFWCEWAEGTRTNLRTHFKFSYRQRYGSGDWKDCPKFGGRGRNTCVVSRNHNNGYSQLIRITSTNHLGSASSEIHFNPGTAAIPNPPTDVEIETLGSEELRVTWGFPSEWDDQIFAYFLEYRLEVITDHGGFTRMIPDVNHGEPYVKPRLYTISNLLPHTPYTVRVSCRSLGSYSADSWSAWSEPVRRRTAEAAPNAAVSEIQGQEYDSINDPAYQRDVFLQWKELPHENRRGKILGYDVDLRQMLANGSSSVVRTVRANGTMILLENLEKFQEYYVDLAVCNSAGRGPIASYFLADKTSEPGPPENVRVQNISETSALVTWQRPTRPNGYIGGYHVQWNKGTVGETSSNSVEVNGTQTSYTINGLEPNRLYQFRVKAKNSRGYSGWSNAPIQHMGGGSRMELLRTLISVLHNLLMDMGEDGASGNEIKLDAISSFL
ncbi:cytokine receptor-like factor 1 [Acanthaster planci]|uniref:Cytokine receptor-like factor 1 n=1 Tax=Acanthaster planci TaxID=133434 RepID=A0A8B7Y7Z4_ACAPL|nr:cytokine receptor-like factor 1 [Acanthaster planci]